MSINPEQIQQVAHLAHLQFDEKTLPSFVNQFNHVLSLIEKINTPDTTGIEPMANALELTQRLRPDTITESNQRDHYQAGAPQTEAGLYLVPQVID